MKSITLVRVLTFTVIVLVVLLARFNLLVDARYVEAIVLTLAGIAAYAILTRRIGKKP